MNINITPEDVDLLVKDAILKAGLGKAITEGVAKTMSSYNNPVDEQLRIFIREIAGQLIREKYSSQIRDLISAYIEKCVTLEIIDSVTNKTIHLMINAAKEDRMSQKFRIRFTEKNKGVLDDAYEAYKSLDRIHQEFLERHAKGYMTKQQMIDIRFMIYEAEQKLERLNQKIEMFLKSEEKNGSVLQR